MINKKALIIIPARGGSKGIPQKNLRFINGKPLIGYTIENALSVENADIIVSTDDKLIKEVAENYNVKVSLRNDKLSDDNATIDDVVYDFIKNNKSNNSLYEKVITLQLTSPLLKKESLQKAILNYEIGTTLVSVTEEYKLIWIQKGDKFVQFHKERKNRQELSPFMLENGAFVISSISQILKHKTRFGKDIRFNIISKEEAIDVDNFDDLNLVDAILKRRNIAIVISGSYSTGLGHVYRGITIGDRFSNDNICYYTHKSQDLAISKIQKYNRKLFVYKDEAELLELISNNNENIVINDFLDTSKEYIKALKNNGHFVANFEDLGSGAYESHILINALYEFSANFEQNRFFGYKYECLREDMFLYPVKTKVKPKAQKVLIAFGGTDINNLTKKILDIITKSKVEVEINIILGLGYKHLDELKSQIATEKLENVKIYQDILLISKFINESDLVITANGRMVYEVVSSATPLLVISQNSREDMHLFPRMCSAIQYIGNYSQIDEEELKKNLIECINNKEKRTQINNELIPFAYEIREGISKIQNIINEKYKMFKLYDN